MATTTTRTRRRRAALAGTLALASVAAIGVAQPALAVSGVATATARLNAAKKTPTFYHGKPFSTAKAKGKTVWYIGNQSSNIIQEWTKETKAALATEGVKLRVYDPGNAIPDHVKGLNLAIANHAAAVILGDGFSPVVFSASVAKAKKAGIPFFSLVAGSTPGHSPTLPGLALDVSYDYVGIGKLLADQVISDTKGKGDVYFIETPDIPSSTFEYNGFVAEIKALAPSIKITHDKFNQSSESDLGQAKFASLAQTAILRDSNLKYIVTAFDSQALFVQTGIQQAGAANKVKTTGFNSIVPQMENLKKGGTPFQMDVGGVNVWLAYALADDVLRSIVGVPLVKDPHVGVRVFAHDNVQSLNVTKEDDEAWYGVNYPKLYETQVWK